MRNSFKIAVLLFAVVLIGVSATVTYYFFSKIIEVRTLPYDFSAVMELRSGINLDEDMVHFGSIPIGYKARRQLQIENENPFPVLVRIESHGTGTEYLKFESTRFSMEGNTNRNIDMFAIPTQPGRYSGEITITIAKK